MVHTKAFIINDLKKRIKLCNDSSSKVKDLHFRLHSNSGEMFTEIEENISEQFEALKQRKEFLYSTVDDFVMKETENLCQKNSEIQSNTAKFEELLSSADYIEDDKMFRSLYENVIDESKSCEEMETSGWEASFYADCKPLADAINGYGMISVERVGESSDAKEKPDLMEGLDDWLSVGSDETAPEREDPPLEYSPNESYGLLETPENKLQELMGGDVENKVCEMKGCCNCVDVCEETLLPLKNVESTSPTKDDLKKWLIGGHKVMPMSSGLPTGLQQIVDNKVFAQFESLKLCDDQKDFGGAKEKVEKLERIEADFKMQDFQGMMESWRGLKINEDYEIESGRLAREGVFDTWDDICRKPLSAWLKSKPLHNVSRGCDSIIEDATLEELGDACSENGLLARDGVLDNWDYICRKPLSAWLKSRPLPYVSKGYDSIIEDAILEELSDACIERGKLAGNAVSDNWDAICRKPLSAWLKAEPMADDSTGCYSALRVAAVEELNDICIERGKLAGNAVSDNWDDICRKPLHTWLKSKPMTDVFTGCEAAFRVAAVEELNGACSERQHWARDAVSDTWEDICRKPLSAWLKSKPQRNVSASCNPAFKGASVKELDDIRSVSLKFWLKRDQMTDIEDLEAIEAICKKPLQYWLKQNNSASPMEIDAPKSSASVSVLKAFDEIRESPLHCWLKKKQAGKVKQIVAQKSPRVFPESKEDDFAPAAVKELNKIIASPLSKWLKNNRHEAVHPFVCMQPLNLRKRCPPSVHVFGKKKIPRPDLNQWLKKPAVSSPKSQNIDFGKWLVK